MPDARSDFALRREILRLERLMPEDVAGILASLDAGQRTKIQRLLDQLDGALPSSDPANDVFSPWLRERIAAAHRGPGAGAAFHMTDAALETLAAASARIAGRRIESRQGSTRLGIWMRLTRFVKRGGGHDLDHQSQ